MYAVDFKNSLLADNKAVVQNHLRIRRWATDFFYLTFNIRRIRLIQFCRVCANQIIVPVPVAKINLVAFIQCICVATAQIRKKVNLFHIFAIHRD